jgi:hypothetical protein
MMIWRDLLHMLPIHASYTFPIPFSLWLCFHITILTILRVAILRIIILRSWCQCIYIAWFYIAWWESLCRVTHHAMI